MFNRTDTGQQWSVHAEFTISHPGVNDPENAPQTHTEHNDNGVRMTYTWTAQDNTTTGATPPPPPPPPPWMAARDPSIQSGASSYRSLYSDTTTQKPTTTYQRGNLFFTSTPPRKPFNLNERLNVQDSGYGSDMLSPGSFGSCTLPRRNLQPYNRKCRSTCNIVLSTSVQDENRLDDSVDSSSTTQCGRTHSLRCQTPTIVRCDRKDNFYGCGDPWCHHPHYGDEFTCTGRISPVLEQCEECPSNSSTRRPSRANTFTTAARSQCTENNNRKDTSVQTFEMIDKCTSPFMKVMKGNEKLNRRKYVGPRRKTEPIFQRMHSPSSFTPDSLDNSQQSRKLTRSPKFGKEVVSDSKSSDNSKKPRTVHIDVYCTGTEIDSDSSSSSENESNSTPQTVFESQKVRITHKRAEESQLPFNIKKSTSQTKNIPQNTSLEKDESDDDDDDDDGTSTAYPSKLSSYSTIRDLSSSISSVQPSWATYSMSSCTVPDDFDSIANTSWKDTFSDIDSLLQSRSSIAQTESLDFVPRRLFEKHSSIDETPEIEKKNLLETPSTSSIQPSDSFEYANSEDRFRIKRMEEMLKNKAKQSPLTENKLLLQQKKMEEYIEKRLSDKNLIRTKSESESSDDLDKGWTFIKGDNQIQNKEILKEDKNPSFKIVRDEQNLEQGSLSDSSPSVSNSVRQRLSLDPNLRSPFTILPGFYTEPRFIAKKFGAVLNVVRKPGHHIGPAKNPDCLCDHCQRHFENIGYRNRTRSMGDHPMRQVINWKEYIRPARQETLPEKMKNRPVYTDF